MANHGIASWERHKALYEQILSWRTISEARYWVIRHLPDLDDNFLLGLDSWFLVDVRQADQASRAAEFIRRLREEGEDIKQQKVLLESILKIETPSEQRNKLKAVMPEITHNFFCVLGCWADESKPNNQSATVLCQELLDSMVFNDLREDWKQSARVIIWGSAWFIKRNDVFSVILESTDNNQLLDYRLLEQNLPFVFHLYASERHPNLALAVLNALLKLSPRAALGNPPISMEDELRFLTLTIGAKVIVALGGEGCVARAKRVLQEAFGVLNKIKPHPIDVEYNLSIEANAAAALDLLGDLELGENNPSQAIRSYTQALAQHKAVAENADEARATDETKRKLALGIANSLWRLAAAEIRTWNLDEAYSHVEQALTQYLSLGLKEHELIEHFQLQARIEFLRTNFDQAESLLYKVMRLRQEGRA